MTFEDYWKNLKLAEDRIQSQSPEQWAKHIWNAAIEAALTQLYHDDYYYNSDNSGWGEDCYLNTYPKSDIKDLLT